jgi:hypothetical protein
MVIHPERWQHLPQRFQVDRPHRMLALDGGGIRGLITLGILEHLEKLVLERTGKDYATISTTSQEPVPGRLLPPACRGE